MLVKQLKKGHRKYMSASPIENRISASLHFNINYIQHVATYNCMKNVVVFFFYY